MNPAMEMHDSIILEFEQKADGTGMLLFRGVVFRSEKRPGHDLPQESGWQNVRMHFTDMILDGKIQEDEPYASHGSLTLDGVEYDNMIPFPLAHTGSVLLSMVLSDDFITTTIRASSISIAMEGEFELEHIWNEDGSRRRPDMLPVTNVA